MTIHSKKAEDSLCSCHAFLIENSEDFLVSYI